MRKQVLLGGPAVLGIVIVAALQTAFVGGTAQAQDYMIDNFESYADTAAMKAVWDHALEFSSIYFSLDLLGGADGTSKSIAGSYGTFGTDNVAKLVDIHLLGHPTDWTGYAHLNIWYKGSGANSADTLKLELYDLSGNFVGSTVLAGTPTQTPTWTLWQADLATLSGGNNNLANVRDLYILVGGPTGTGTVNIDQVELAGAVVVNAPVITDAGDTLDYTEGDGAVAIDDSLTVSDPDSANLQSATVEITGNYQNGEDVLDCVTPGGLAEAWSAATGILELTGDAPLATYETALESVTYQNTAIHPRSFDRSVRWRVNDGTDPSAPAFSTITVTPTAPAMIDDLEGYADTYQMNDVWDHPFEGIPGWLDLDTTDGADGSAQSLEFDYNGSALIDHIEVLDLKDTHGLPSNWSGIGFLNIWYRGQGGNSAEELDVTLYDSSATEIGYSVLPGNPTQTTDWTLWQADLSSGFTGGNGLSDVASLYIQVSKKGTGADGTGTMNIDQVELTDTSAVVSVGIDIYPNRTPNQVFLSRNYTLYVAVLGTADFEVATLDSSSVLFGQTGTEASPVRAPLLRDLNRDGFLDAMYGFRTLDCGFELGDTEGILTGSLFDGTDVRGVDSVLVSP